MADVTTEQEAAQSIKARFVAQWVDEFLAALSPIAFANQRFTQPSAEPWVEFLVNFFDGQQTTIGGSRRYQTKGLIHAEINVPPNTGETDALTLANMLRGIFNAVSFDGITCMTPEVHTVGLVGTWYIVVVEAIFWYETTD